jgi:hypothetical protein
MAARSDEYLRKLLQKGGHLLKCFSPTINPLTFAYALPIAAAKNLFCASQDIKYAYLNAEMPGEVEPVITKLDDDIAKICGLPLGHLYCIMKAMYGLPAIAGRLELLLPVSRHQKPQDICVPVAHQRFKGVLARSKQSAELL